MVVYDATFGYEDDQKVANDHYSLTEVATLLNKNLRQIRYLIRQGRLPASKEGGRWVVKKSDVDVKPTAPQAEAVARAEAAAGSAGRRYSVNDLRVFQTGQALFREVVDACGPQHSISLRLRGALEAVTLGCHAFEPDEKLELFRRARRDLATAVAELLLSDAPPTEAERDFATRIEQTLIPQVSGLVRAADRSARGRRSARADGRFRSFGTARGG